MSLTKGTAGTLYFWGFAEARGSAFNEVLNFAKDHKSRIDSNFQLFVRQDEP